MITKKVNLQKSIRFDIHDFQALDILATRTDRSVNELVAEGVHQFIGANYGWLADGYLQRLDPELYNRIVSWVESYIDGTMTDNDRDQYFLPSSKRIYGKDDADLTPFIEVLCWNPVLIVLESESAAVTGLNIVLGIKNDALFANYSIHAFNEAGQRIVLEERMVQLCCNLKFFNNTKEDFLNPIFARYFWFFPYVGKNYISLVWNETEDQ